MYSDEQAQRITSPPNLDLLTASQAKTVVGVLDDLTKSNFESRQIRPQLPALTARMGSACVSPDDLSRMVDELDRWVRWRRLPGYWLSFLFQQSMAQQQSVYFAAGCLLYADAQINLNMDLSLPSLENGYNSMRQVLAQQNVPSLRNIAVGIEARMRMVFRYYRDLYLATSYNSINQLTEHLYSQKTWRDLMAAFPELRKPRRGLTPADYLTVIDQCTHSNDTYGCVLTRRFLGSVYEGRNHLDEAAQQFRLALEAAQSAGLDTEIGHLHRLYGYVLRNTGHLEEAAREFQDAYDHESDPAFAYWQALSARELGDLWLRRLPRVIDRSRPPKEPLAETLKWYKTGRRLFENHVGQGVLPVARAVKQQLFRSYVDNSIQVAALANGADAVAEVEALGPRYATDIVAEGRAAATLGADAYAKYLRCRAIFHEHLATFNQGDFDQDFRDYIAFVEKNREARQFYMRTRIQLTGPIIRAQLSDEITDKLLSLPLPNLAFLLFHIGSQETYTELVVPGGGVPLGKARRPEVSWQEVDRAYQNEVKQAQLPPPPDPALFMRQAIDSLLAVSEECFSPFLEPGLAALQGRQLKVFPRLSLNAVPFHALKVKGKPLIEYCDVSYGQTLGMFFQIHRGAPSTGLVTLAAVYDECGTKAYKGTFQMLDAAGDGKVSMLPTSSWEDVRAALAGRPPSDLFFACHGEYDREDPAKSLLYLRREQGVEVRFFEIFSRLDLTGCRSVTLGACESGIARTLVSAEYIGLPMAFLAAGAQYVIATLWRAHEIAAAILLGHHYRFLKDGKHTVVAALNEAQRVTMRMSQAEVMHWLTEFLPERAQGLERSIRSMEDPPFAHPYYWACFYVAGDV